VGSVTIDARLMREAGIVEYEKVAIADIDNGNRFETYVITGDEDSGIICLNGAAARCVSAGDKVIIMAYADMPPEEARTFKPAVLFVDEHNKIIRKASYEHHGLLSEQ
jgi:aspartate 1-decarboxylase